MAANSIPADVLTGDRANPYAPAKSRGESFSLVTIVSRLLAPAASLNLTVTLLCMAIFLVFVGTLAQDEEEMWQVVANYFRSFITFVEFEVFFPKSWFPTWQDKIPGGFWFPGGLTIGSFMTLNLFAAHAVRFKVQAKGGQLLGGLLVILIGALVALFVIISGHNSTGLQDEPSIGWTGVWYLLKTFVVSLWLASVIGGTVYVAMQGIVKPLPILTVIGVFLFTLFVLGLLYAGDKARLSDSSLRILWQLAQGWLAALIMLVGCGLAFRKRAGIVLLHLGVGLIMFNEVFVALKTVEERMHMEEGQIVNFARDIRSVEMAVVDSSGDETDSLVVVPTSRLKRGETLRHELLPFDVHLVDYLKNAEPRALEPDEKPIATAGEGVKMGVKPLRPGSGADTDSAVDMAAAYVKLSSKTGGDDLGTYLLSQFMGEQDHGEPVKVGGKTYNLLLRFKRNYKPYAVRLLDVSKRDYVGTATPRDYRSIIQLIDPARNFDRDDIQIWMNNPLRYAGETFYQSGYNRGRNGIESTDLQLVTNTGWMIPYLGCMVVGTGLLAQFGLTLLRFINKLTTPPPAPGVPLKPAKGPKPARQLPPLRPATDAPRNTALHVVSIAFTVFMLLVCGGYLASKARSPRMPADGFDIDGFGRLPLVYQGRVKPFDTLARNSMRIISDREDFKDEEGNRQPAMRWLLDVISEVKTKVQVEVKDEEPDKKPEVDESLKELIGEQAAKLAAMDPFKKKKFVERDVPRAFTYKIIRIEHPEVLSLFKLPPRIGSYRYSAHELYDHMQEFQEEVAKASQAKEKSPAQMTTYQKKLLELAKKIHIYGTLIDAFHTIDLPSVEQITKESEDVQKTLLAIVQRIQMVDQALDRSEPPLAVPVPVKHRQKPGMIAAVGGEEKWLPYARAWHQTYLKRELLKQPTNPAADRMHNMLEAYAVGNSGAFNRELKEYQEWLASAAGEDLKALAEEHKTAIDVAPANDEPAFLNFFKVRFEAFFNNFAPFYYCAALYVVAFLLSLLALLVMPLGWSLPFRRASFWLITLTLVVHTFALISRIYISGRPPVTNLYSSAIFIGWGVVVLGLIFEVLFRLGIGNLVGTVVGFATLIIAHNLAGDGDTFTVLQAVLDTQFWLATHVTCVTLGYAATFVAGALGVTYVLLGLFTPALGMRVNKVVVDGIFTVSNVNETVGRVLGWMIYGTLCFALLLSFVGTVLGGLWADDSWGRFWGWDPKENGALIIVLWNAVILHARWGGLVKDRGMAVLSIVGNIVTCWSWFGVNELGIGLHSYGFTEGVLRNLSLFVMSQLFLIGLGCLPKSIWASTWANQAAANEAPLEAEVV